MRPDFSEHGTSSPLEDMPSSLQTTTISAIIWSLSYMLCVHDSFDSSTTGWKFLL